MSHRTLTAAAALFTTLATAAGAGATAAAPAAWVPTLVNDDVFQVDAAAFPDGTGLVASDAPASRDGGDLAYRRMLYRTGDGGRTWAPVRPGLPRDLDRVAFGSATEWWGIPWYGDHVSRTPDAGATWYRSPLPGRLGAVRSVSAAGGAVAVAGRIKATSGPSCSGYASDAIAWSTDRGATWAEHRFGAYHSGTAGWVHSVRVADARTGLALVWGDVRDCSGTVGSEFDVHVTRDAGATWTRVARSVPNGRRVQNASVTPAGLVSVGWSDGTVSVSEDGGTTFRDTTLRRYDSDRMSGFDAVLYAAFAGRTGYAVQAGGTVWRTTDAGATWLLDGQVSPLELSAELLPFDGSRALLVGRGAVLTRLAP